MSDDAPQLRARPSIVFYLHGDDLGSASLATSITGTLVNELR